MWSYASPNMNEKLLILVFVIVLLPESLWAQQKLWTKLTSEKKVIATDKNLPSNSGIYQLDNKMLRSKLINAPERKSVFSKSKVKINFPDASGKLIEYYIKETSFMHPDLAKKFPNSKSYIGEAVHHKGTSIRFSLNSLGLYAMIFSVGKSTVYIDPVNKEENVYAVYKRKNLKAVKSFECLVTEQVNTQTKVKSNLKNANDLQLRTFELALATTEEYSDFHTSGLPANSSRADSISVVIDAINVTLTRVNGLFERDVALTMQLVPNNDQLIFLSSDPGDDPYTNNNGSAMLGENQTTIDNIIGSANYDIGHVFSTGGGGVAFFGSPCGNSKAGGVTGLPNPVGDPFDVDFVAHEFGHQLGANHTFNGTSGNCAGTNRNNATAVEPGSGTTIMAYAGICSPQNVQLSSDDYFHTISIQEMFSFISSGSSACDDETVMTNNMNAPTANAGSDFTVPISTPLVLKGQGSDADGDPITYIWEQTDNETAGISIPPSSTQTGGAVFRSLAPGNSTDRYLPELSTVVAGNLSSAWQVLPSVGRTMDFTLTVRDNVVNEGQTASDIMTITVDENSGPFEVTSQNADNVFWVVGASQTITWDVANTDQAPVDSPNINIMLSLDGGFTYPITLASNTPNDGSHEITVPNNLTSNARIKVEGANHIFYALNSSDITIVNDFALTTNQNEQTACIPDDAVFDFQIDFASGFSETVNFTAIDVPNGASVSFNPVSANSTSNIQCTIGGISAVDPGEYTIQVIGASTGLSRSLDLILTVFDTTITEPVITNPVDGATGVLAIETNFAWQADANVEDYDIEIATDVNFNTIIESANVSTNSYVPQNLQNGTVYFWRIKPNNVCATTNFSAVSTFTTSEIVCNPYNATDTPVNIPDNNASGVNSVINVVDDFIMSDVNVTINISHSWMQDLIFSLESPQGTSIELVNRQCSGASGNQNMATTFDDLGIDLVCANSSPVITGTIKPSEELLSFNGESSLGDWVLTVSDNAGLDTGSITSWSLELCESVVVASLGKSSFQDLVIWPNPAKDFITISFLSPLNSNPTRVRIYDIIGREVLSKKYNYETVLFNEQIEIGDLTSGTYLVHISHGNENTTKRLLIF